MTALADAVHAVVAADAELQAQQPTPFPLPITGLEAVVAGAVTALTRGDWWVPGLRERVGAVLRDVPLARLIDGTAGARPYKVAPPTPSPALRALTAVGLAAGGTTTLVHLAVGSTADGAFHEALNLAALQQVPVIFLVAVHPLGGDAPVAQQSAADLPALAKSFGLPVKEISGRDAQAVYSAVAAAKSEGGPQVIVAAL